MGASQAKLFLLDAMALLYRAHYAMQAYATAHKAGVPKNTHPFKAFFVYPTLLQKAQ